MPITVPQNKTNSFTTAQGSSTFVLSFTSGIAAGSIIFVRTTFDPAVTSASIDDGHGDTVTDSGAGTINDAGTGTKSLIQAFFSPVTGAQTITVTYSGGGANPSFADLTISEVAGLTSAQFDKVVHATGTGQTGDSGASGTLSASAEACFGYELNTGTSGTIGAGWTSDDGATGVITGTGSLVQHQIVSSNASLHSVDAGNGSSSGNTWLMWFASVMSGAGGDVLAASPGLRVMRRKSVGWTPLSDSRSRIFRPRPKFYLPRKTIMRAA